MKNDNEDTEDRGRRADDKYLIQSVMEAREMSIKAEGKADSALLRLEGHETVCAQRYEDIISAVKGLNGKLYAIILGVSGSALAGMAALVFLLLKNGAKL